MKCVLPCGSLWVAIQTSYRERSVCPRISNPMQQLAELEAALKADTDLRQRIVRSIGSASVALFALVDDHGKHLLELAGSGTLVIVKGVHYILTAAHVWEEVL